MSTSPDRQRFPHLRSSFSASHPHGRSQQHQLPIDIPHTSPAGLAFHANSTTSPSAADGSSYDFGVTARGSGTGPGTLSPTALSSSSSSNSVPNSYERPGMIGSIPPQPAPYADTAMTQYMSELNRQNALSSVAFESLGQRQHFNHTHPTATTTTYPNLQGLDTSNLGGNIHPSALYSAFSFDNSHLPSYPHQQQQQHATTNGNGFPHQLHAHVPEALFFSPQPNQSHNAGFPDVGPSYSRNDTATATPVQYHQQQAQHVQQQQHAQHVQQQYTNGLVAQQAFVAGISPSSLSWDEHEYFPPEQYAQRPQASAVQHQAQLSGSSNSLPSLGSASSSSQSLPQYPNPQQLQHAIATNGSGAGAGGESSSGSGSGSRSRKRMRMANGTTLPRDEVKPDLDEGEDDGDESDSGVNGTVPGLQQGKEVRKTQQACSHCKRLKMRCEREPGQAKCNRCLHRNQDCKYEGRKQRVKSNWREVLNKKLAEKDATIQSLIKLLNNPWQNAPFPSASSAPVTGHAGPSNPNLQRSPSDIQAWAAEATAATSVAGAHDHLSPTSARSQPLSMRARLLSDGEPDSGDEGGDTDDDRPLGAGIRNNRSPSGQTAELLPTPETPFGLLADASRANMDATARRAASVASDVGERGDEEDAVGFANENFFAPGPTVNAGLRRRIIEWQTPPEITERGIVSPDEVRKLFNIFYDRLNPVLAIFDPNIHTPAHVYGRCPFLFTVVCAIASRYYRERPELYQIAMHLARTSAATSLINGWKSLEICQAYIMMSVYSLPAKRWEEDRSWLYLGLAIRMATDLNLHVPITAKGADEVTEREILNRYRTWQICFNLDRSAATQLGRPTAIREDYIIRHSANFYKRSKFNHPYDIHLCAYTNLLRIMARFLEAVYSDPNAPTGLNKNIDWLGVTTKFEQELQKYRKDTEARFALESNKRDPACRYRVELLPFLFQYSRLVLWSFGFQQAFEKKLPQAALADFFDNAYGAATEVVRIVVTRLAKTEYFSFAPDGHFLFVAFASAFLLKLLRPEFLPLLAETQQAHIVSMITSVVEVFNNVAIDNMHTPRLYARFLQTLLEKRHAFTDEANTQQIEAGHEGQNAPEDAAPAITVTEAAQQPAQATVTNEQASLRPITPVVYVEGSVSGTVSTVGDETEVPGSTLGGGSLFNLDDMENDDDYLASMRALNNPNWASNLLMPGWTWPSADDPMDWFGNLPEEQPDPTANYMEQLETFTNLNTM